MKPGFPVLAGWLCIQILHAQTATPPIGEILARVQTNTGQFEQSLPDFVCDEKIRSQKTGKGALARETTAESHFTGLQKKSGTMSFTETRELVTFDGQPAAKGQNLSRILLFTGGFSSILDMTFSAKFVPSHDYRISGKERFDGRPALAIDFATKPDQKELKAAWNGKPMLQRDTGKAWIDEETLQVLRIERRFLNVPPKFSGMVATVDYGPVSIDGKPFWMPLRVKVDLGAKGGTRWAFTAGYTNYRKFEVSSGIDYQPAP